MLSVVVTCKSIPHGDTEMNTAAASTQSQLHGSLDEYTAEDYCVSHGEFFCIKTKHYACVRAGMCMIGPEHRENSSTVPIAVTGACPYYPHDSQSLWCLRSLHGYYRIPLSMSVFELMNYTCSYYNRRGLMCSQCQTGYGPAVYAFSLMCAKCTDNGIGWVLYFALTLLPITMFYFIVILFNVRVTTPPLAGLVFMCQTYNFIEKVYVDFDMKVVIASRMYVGASTNERILRILVHSVRVLCGFWNLDFFRFIIPPFCVSSHLSNSQALLLEYVYVVYPLFLLVFTSVCIELHDRNFKPLVLAWKPFRKIFVRLQKTWDPTASIIHSFSTFTLLYTSKLLFIASYLIYPTKFYHLMPSSVSYNETAELREYFDPSNKVHSKHYLQYVSCSLIFLAIFFVCPTLLLCLYPLKIFRRFLRCCLPSKLRLIIYTFIDTFQGHYKDGTNGTRDYRVFSMVQMILLGSNVILRMNPHINVHFATLPTQVICIMGSLLFAIVRPCKKKHANILQSLLMALTAFVLLTLHPSLSSPRFAYTSLMIMLICILFPHIVFGGYIIYRIVQRANTRFGFSDRILKCLRKEEMMDTLPVDSHCNQQRLVPTENTALLR